MDYKKSVGFTDVGLWLYRISESVRTYAYLILSSQASARSSIVENTVSALTAQSAFLNNFEDIVNRRVNIQEDIKRYQDTLSYASSKVDYSVGENIYMLPSDMNLTIRSGTVGYNNKILVSDEKFSLGKNEKVNSIVLGPRTPLVLGYHSCGEPVITMPKVMSHKAIAKQTKSQKPTHEEEKIAFVLFLAGEKDKTHVRMLRLAVFATWDFNHLGF